MKENLVAHLYFLFLVLLHLYGQRQVDLYKAML
jgi:hypothetical protein